MTKQKLTPEARERKNSRQRDYGKRTGYKAQTEYAKKTYTRMVLNVKNDIAEQYKAKCTERGISYSEPLHAAIQRFIEEGEY